MITPILNSICSYTLKEPFTTLNDIYKVTEILSYTDALTRNIDFVKNLYAPAGLTATQYTSDMSGYTKDQVYYLIPVNQNTHAAIYVFSSLLNSIPDPMVQQYTNLGIGVKLGLFQDQAKALLLIDQLNAIIESITGISATAQLYSMGTQYLKLTDYQLIDQLRDQNTKQYKTFYQLYQEQLALTKQAQNLNKYYEDTLLAINNQQQS